MRPTVHVLLVAALLAGTGTRALAQADRTPDTLLDLSLEALLNITITTATRTAEGATLAPARVQVVTAAQVERRGYRSLADLLSDLPELKIDLAGDQDMPTQFTVRGTRGSSRIVLLLDGMRISSPTNEPLPILANYPVHAARQIEIVYGPASALYGADAFSAVVNIISRGPSDRPGLTVGTSIGQFGLVNQTASYAAHLGRNASLAVAGQFLYDQQPDLTRYYPEDFGGLEAQGTGVFPTIFGPMTSDRPVSPAYDVPLSAHSLQATLTAGGFRVSFFENHARVSTTPAYTPDNAVYNDAAFNKNDLLVVGGSYTHDVGPVASTSSVTVSRHVLDPESGYWNVYSNMKKSYKYAYGSMVKLEQQASWNATSSLTMTAGGNVERYFAIPQGADLNAPLRSRDAPGTILDTDIPDALNRLRYSNVGTYGQMQYALTSRTSMLGGLRSDYNTRYGWTVNPRVGLVTQPTEQTTVKLLYGTAYLAPSPFQSYSHYGAFYSMDGGETYQSDYWHVPNPNLEPQTKRTTEVELRHSVAASLTVWGSGFYSRFSNAIKESDADQAYAGTYLGWPVAYIDFSVNQGRSTTYGGTIGMDVLRSWAGDRRLEGRLALSLADGKVWDDDEAGTGLPIAAMAPMLLKGGIDLDWGPWVVAPRLVVVGAQRLTETILTDDTLRRRTLDGYATVGLNVRRTRLFKNTTAFLTVENLLDARYRQINARAYANPEELIGAPQNPRRLTVGVELRLP